MPVINENPNKTEVKGLGGDFVQQKQNPDFDVVNTKNYEQKLENLFQSVIQKNLHEIKEEKADPNKKGIKDKLNQLSKVLFSRESTYRGLLDILAEELPSLIVESLRGFNSFVEHLFKYIVTTSVIMGVPILTKFISGQSAKNILKKIDPKNHGLALLFNREDFEDSENFQKAKARIIKEETLDKMNLIRFGGLKSSEKNIEKATAIKDFVVNLDDDETLRKEALELKDTVIQRQTWAMAIASAAIPYVTRLFRKYALGIDRFVGSQKYLSDEDAKKLGSKGFTLRQALGTAACMVTTPLFAQNLVKKFQTQKPEERHGFNKMMAKQLDTKHSFYPKVGTYILSTSLPYLIARLFNAQDKYEFMETMLKTSFNGGSLFFGDRITNGLFAKKADKELQEKYQTKPGILYETQDPQKGFWHWLGDKFPEARKIAGIVEKTQDNKELQEEATDKYQSSFLKGFGVHSLGIVFIKFALNHLTKMRVKKDLKALKTS